MMRSTKALEAEGVEIQRHNGSLLNEPGEVQTGSGGAFRVFTPYYRVAREKAAGAAATRAPEPFGGYTETPPIR